MVDSFQDVDRVVVRILKRYRIPYTQRRKLAVFYSNIKYGFYFSLPH